MLSPSTEAELSASIADANTPLSIAGGGTRPIGNPVVGTHLTTSGLSGITLYEPGALTIVVAAGTPVDEVEAALAKEKQRLPFEPMDHRKLLGTDGVPTIGGATAANVSGPRRIQAGACRDSLIGVRFVDGRGDIIKNGGRVMKNVTGYDLVKLLAGSFGTLGVLTEVSFKVLPSPDAVATLTLKGLSVDRAIAALSCALGSPYEVTGAAHIPDGSDAPRTLIRIEGFTNSVAYRAGQLAELLASFGVADVETDPEACSETWREVRDVEPFGGTSEDIWRLSVAPSDAPGVAIAIHERGAGRMIFDWGGGLIWAEASPGSNLRYDGLPGHATLMRAEEETKMRLGAFHPEPKPLAQIAKDLRAKFDPKGILTPGKMEIA